MPTPPSPLGTSIPQPAPAKIWRMQEADFRIANFRFRDGSALPESRIHYSTLGRPHRNAAGEIDDAVMVLHGTGGTGHQFLVPQFADELYGPGQPLAIRRYWIILPDGIGHGNRPSRPMGCTCASRTTPTTTWSRRNTGCCTITSASSACGSSWARRWAACTG